MTTSEEGVCKADAAGTGDRGLATTRNSCVGIDMRSGGELPIQGPRRLMWLRCDNQ